MDVSTEYLLVYVCTERIHIHASHTMDRKRRCIWINIHAKSDKCSASINGEAASEFVVELHVRLASKLNLDSQDRKPKHRILKPHSHPHHRLSVDADSGPANIQVECRYGYRLLGLVCRQLMCFWFDMVLHSERRLRTGTVAGVVGKDSLLSLLPKCLRVANVWFHLNRKGLRWQVDTSPVPTHKKVSVIANAYVCVIAGVCKHKWLHVFCRRLQRCN